MTNKVRLGFAICGSFCTLQQAITQLEILAAQGYDLYPIMSEIVSTTDTRFGTAQEWKDRIKSICQKDIITSIKQAEPIGPKQLLDILVVAPCTGNTIGKLACGITDSAVCMAVKAHLRNARPVVIAVSTNDALAASAKNIGTLMANRNLYFVPMRQDDYINKPTSVVADFSKIPATVEEALRGRQIQPIFV